MGDAGEAGRARYRAFISYSHRDAAFGRRLHRRLERYGLPRRLVGRPGPRGPVPRRLTPIFRDREELTAAHDLTAEVRAALAASESLIVVCSPNAAASPWVAREVELFRELHPDRPILAALAAGEPGDCFPEPLSRGAEPLAADFRKEGDGGRLALLKLVAGMVGVGLDELVQRDAQRRMRNVMAVTGAALAAVLAMGLLTTYALRAEAEAKRQRAEAERLVEFMQTDLRDRLRGVGRLDVMDAVNHRALAYYDAPDLDDRARARRARVLHAVGENEADAGQLAPARRHFADADAITSAQLRDAPTDPERILAQAQSEYWLGYADYREQRFGPAKARFVAYRRLADDLVRRYPRVAAYRKELAYAEGNLCSVALSPPADGRGAVQHCSLALATLQALSAEAPRDRALRLDVINRHGWMADAYMAAGDNGQATAQRTLQLERLAPMIAEDPQNLDLRTRWVAAQSALATLEFRAGKLAEANARFKEVRRVVDLMIAFDPTNARWLWRREQLGRSIAYLDRQTAAKGTADGRRH